MLKFAKMFGVVLVAMFLCSVPAVAQELSPDAALNSSKGWAWLGAGIAAGAATIGGAYGIGRLATGAMEGTARQPEAGGTIRVSMIIAAALIEGFTFAAIIVGFMLAGK